MTIEKTFVIPADRRLTIEVPNEIPVGPVILTFTSVPAATEVFKKSEARDIELINHNAERLNQEAMDVLSFQRLEI